MNKLFKYQRRCLKCKEHFNTRDEWHPYCQLCTLRFLKEKYKLGEP